MFHSLRAIGNRYEAISFEDIIVDLPLQPYGCLFLLSNIKMLC